MSHMTSGPVVALCLQRENAVGRLLEVLGPSDPRAAKKQSQFFLRGSFGEDCIQNGFYGTYMETSICNLMNANFSISSYIFGNPRVVFGNLRTCSEDLRLSEPSLESSGRSRTSTWKQKATVITH